MLTQEQKYIISISIAFVVGIVVFIIMYKYKVKTVNAVLLSLIPFLILILLGLRWATKSKENYNHLLNDSALNEDVIMNWIDSLDPKLTSDCKNCIVESALKIWSEDTFAKVKSFPVKRQKAILGAMLVFDCSKQCVIPPLNLNEPEVGKWVKDLNPDIPDTDYSCAMSVILRNWCKDEFSKLLQTKKSDQNKVLESVIAFNCKECDLPSRLSVSEIQKWIYSLLSEIPQNCTSCVINTLNRIWTVVDLKRVKKMDKNSQLNILQALLSLDCNNECIEIPSGLNRNVVSQWLDTVNLQDNADCKDCIVSEIMRLWTPEILQSVRLKSEIEQSKIVQGIAIMNCKACKNNNLSVSQVSEWVDKILPNANNACLSCVKNNIMNTYDGSQFENLLLRPSIDQSKTARLIADFICPSVCVMQPEQISDYLMY